MPHRALGRDLDQLVIALVDNRRPMLAVIRAMLAAIGTGRVETYESPVDALDRMPPDLPDLVIAGAAMQPLSGTAMVRAMRRTSSGPLALVPAMIMAPNVKLRSGQARIRCWFCRLPRARSIVGSTG